MNTRIYDNRSCLLGEGPLWHPERNQLFWFDILERKLLSRSENGPQEWVFDDMVSAAGWINADSLVIASETGLWRFDIAAGSRELLCPLEADDKKTRSNDGRADPWGGFWIGTMGKDAEPHAGAIYRYYEGKLRRLFGNITISNAICFAPDKSRAIFTDTATGQVMQVALDEDGWPSGNASLFLDLAAEQLNPDGAVFDAEGALWIAQWGAARVAAYDAEGKFLRAVSLPARHTSCPAFGGKEFRTLFVTSARQGIATELLAESPEQGMLFAVEGLEPGFPEPRVIL